MKKIIFTFALLFTYSLANASDFKKQTIEIDDAPVCISESLQGHEIKSVTKHIDQVGNESYYVVIHKIGKKHFKSVYSVTGVLERENRQLLGMPYAIGIVFTGLIWLSLAL